MYPNERSGRDAAAVRILSSNRSTADANILATRGCYMTLKIPSCGCTRAVQARAPPSASKRGCEIINTALSLTQPSWKNLQRFPVHFIYSHVKEHNKQAINIISHKSPPGPTLTPRYAKGQYSVLAAHSREDPLQRLPPPRRRPGLLRIRIKRRFSPTEHSHSTLTSPLSPPRG